MYSDSGLPDQGCTIKWSARQFPKPVWGPYTREGYAYLRLRRAGNRQPLRAADYTRGARSLHTYADAGAPMTCAEGAVAALSPSVYLGTTTATSCTLSGRYHWPT